MSVILVGAVLLGGTLLSGAILFRGIRRTEQAIRERGEPANQQRPEAWKSLTPG